MVHRRRRAFQHGLHRGPGRRPGPPGHRRGRSSHPGPRRRAAVHRDHPARARHPGASDRRRARGSGGLGRFRGRSRGVGVPQAGRARATGGRAHGRGEERQGDRTNGAGTRSLATRRIRARRVPCRGPRRQRRGWPRRGALPRVLHRVHGPARRGGTAAERQAGRPEVEPADRPKADRGRHGGAASLAVQEGHRRPRPAPARRAGLREAVPAGDPVPRRRARRRRTYERGRGRHGAGGPATR